MNLPESCGKTIQLLPHLARASSLKRTAKCYGFGGTISSAFASAVMHCKDKGTQANKAVQEQP